MMNEGSSPYHAIQGLFCRDPDYALLAVEGKNAVSLNAHWNFLKTEANNQYDIIDILPSGKKVHTKAIDLTSCGDLCSNSTSMPHDHVLRELYHTSKHCYLGLLSCRFKETTEKEAAFQDWIETYSLLETTLVPKSKMHPHSEIQILQIAEQITTLFETTLRNISSQDEWHIGRDQFIRRVFDFIARGERIQFGVPAFPCKSPNKHKVGGVGPDMAERVALQTLHTFTKKLQELYAPGATIWIINDGHVFSDCIGTDDKNVLDYESQLQDIYRASYTEEQDREAVRFCGLNDMFFNNPDAANTFSETWISEFSMAHPIESNHLANAERARKIMMAGYQSLRSHFEKLIADQHPATLGLYRGQARFMQDDLATADFLAKSTKQKKKISFIVAAEMIARNQAYSNLLELLYPNFVRLSIHAHSNKGPKFGICLFPRDKFRAIDSVTNRHEPVPAYEFQVPTPWHNAIIKVEGDSMIYLGKASTARAAIEAGKFHGGWVQGPSGGHFVLRAATCNMPDERVIEDSVPIISTPISTATTAFIIPSSEHVTAPSPISSPAISTCSSTTPTMVERNDRGKGLGILKSESEVVQSTAASMSSGKEKCESTAYHARVFCGVFDAPTRFVRRAFRYSYRSRA